MIRDQVPLNNPSKIIQYIQNLKFANSTKKTYLCAIINHYRNDAILNKNLSQLNDYFSVLRGLADKKAESQTLTDAQKANFVTWEDIQANQKAWASEVDWAGDISTIRDFVIMSLYTLNDPVRADYGRMRVAYHKPIPVDSEDNWLVWGKTKKSRVFVFNDYKTSAVYGKVKIPVSLPLQEVLEKWFAVDIPHDFILSGTYTPNALVKRLRVITERRLGKKVGINIFRHSRVTHELEGQKTILEKKPLAMNMLHSTATQEKYLAGRG